MCCTLFTKIHNDIIKNTYIYLMQQWQHLGFFLSSLGTFFTPLVEVK